MKYIRIEGEEAFLQLTQGKETIVDAEDVERIMEHTWSLAEVEPGRFYVRSSKRQYLHRFLLGVTDRSQLVDHRDGDGLNNRKSNLRKVTNQQNLENRKGANSNSKTGIRGVTVHKCKPSGLMYSANVTVKGKHLAKYFPYTEEGLQQAAQAVEQMRQELMTHSES